MNDDMARRDAGLNLYNNGFAAGSVASVLVPVIIAIRSGKRPEEGVAKDGEQR